jgi:beta-lactamase regulating signal transducer with metallopeptidase domain/tetratricopeptide (TPR) repeat protein
MDTTMLLLIVARVTVVALIGRLLLAAMTRAAASTRYLVSVTTFCSMLAVALLSGGPQWRLALLPPNTKSAPAITTAEAIEPESDSRLTVVGNPIAPAAPAAEESLLAAWRGWLLPAILAVAAIFVARMAFGVIAIRWITHRAREIEDDSLVRDFDVAGERLGVARMVRLLASERVTVPLVWGVTRPALLLPANALEWSRDRLRVVFLHELAHLRRGDAITLLLTRAIAALFWFHPLAWSLDRAARRDCEQACDDLVLATGTRASDYADHLLGIARSLPAHDPFGAVTLAMSRRSQLEGRLLSILQPDARRGGVSRRAAGIATAVAMLFVLPLATIRLTAQPAPVVEQQTEVRQAVERHADESRAEARPTSGEGWFKYGKEAFAHDDFQASIAAYLHAIELEYRPAAAMYNIACAYAAQDNSESALHWLEKAVENGFEVGKLADDSDLDALRSDPRFARIANRSGERESRGEVKQRRAIEQYEALRAQGSRNAEDWYQAGKEMLQRRDLPRAIAAFTETIRLDPFAGSAWYNLACAQALSGDHNRALDTLEQSILHNFGGDSEKLLDDPDLASIRGPRLNEIARLADDLELRTEGNDWQDAIVRYERIARERPNTPRALFNYGFVLVEGGQARTGIGVFTRVLNMGYRPGTVMYNLGCAHALLGERQAALGWLMKAANAGFDVGGYAKGDDDLKSVRDDSWLAERIAEARRKHDEKKEK